MAEKDRDQGTGIRQQGSRARGRRGGGGDVGESDGSGAAGGGGGQGDGDQPVPNTVTTRTSSTTEIASLSEQPDRVQATSKPTSQPISAVVGTASTQQNRAQAIGIRDVSDSDCRRWRVRSGERLRMQPVAAYLPTEPSAPKWARSGARARRTSDAVPARAALPTADGETSLVRALGLKIGRIVIDAGHGGHDSGTIGVGGIEEKDVVLDVALRLGKLLHERLGAEIIYTRSDDTFIPLETRTAIANKAQADLFLSIHANSSSDATARGVETYYLNFTSTPDALETAARENAVSTQSIHQLSDLVKKIALKDKIDESREFASDVQQGLYAGLTQGQCGAEESRREEGSVCGADRGEYAVGAGGDLVCDQSAGREPAAAAGVSRARGGEPVQGRGAV